MTEKKSDITTEPRFKQPNAFVYGALLFAARIVGLIFNIKVNRESKKELKKISAPVIAVSPHLSPIDFALMALMMAPKRVSFVVASHMLYAKFYGWFIRKTRFCIPKQQLTADLSSVRSIKKMIDAGVSVGIYPEGRMSCEGKEEYISPSIGKLIKWLKVPVVIVKTEGSFLAMPRYVTTLRRGRVNVSGELLFSVEEIERLSVKELKIKLREAMKINEYEYQEKNGIMFKGKNLAEGLHKMLYRCPKCESDFTMRGEGDRLYCVKCGNEFIFDALSVLTPVNDSVGERRPDLWYDMQREALIKEMDEAGDDFALESETELQLNDIKTASFQTAETGLLRLDKNGFTYKGENYQLHFPINTSPSISVNMGEWLNFCKDDTIYRFYFPKEKKSGKFNLATELLFYKYYDTEKAEARK